MKKQALSAVLVSGLLALSLAGCSDDDGEKPQGDGTTSRSATASESVDPGNVSPTDLPTLPAVKDEQGAIKDLTLGDCATEAGKQTVSGEITSSADKAADYLISVSWTTAAGDVMGRGYKVLKGVNPGDTARFKIRADVADGATQCVPGVVYGKVG